MELEVTTIGPHILHHLSVACLVDFNVQVLDMETFETRQNEYAMKGQKHFYFMTLNANEVDIFT